MGWFSDLFGSNDDALKAQTRSNTQAQKFIEEQAEKARSDVLGIQPHADQARNAGYQSAIDMLTGSLPSQMDVFGDGNVAAQDILGQGFTAQQNAILGLPVEMPGSVRLSPDLSAFQNVQLPEFTAPQLLSGESNQINYTPGETTNRELVSQAHNKGLISPEDYGWFQKYFNGASNAGANYSWGRGENPGELINRLEGSGLNATNRARMENLYYAMFGGQ